MLDILCLLYNSLQLNAGSKNIGYMFGFPVVSNCHIFVYHQMLQLTGGFSRTTLKWQMEHPYAWSGAEREIDFGPPQDDLVSRLSFQ